MPANGMKVLVTGATGFLGRALVPLLLDHGNHVVATARDPIRLQQLEGAEKIVCDLTDPHAFDVLPRSVDAVVHLAQSDASRTEAGKLEGVNVQGTASLLEYARGTRASRFVFTSSGSVYGAAVGPLHETDIVRGGDPYADSKVAAERLVLQSGRALGGRVLRLFVPYGPGQQGRLIPTLLDRVTSGEPVILSKGARPRLNPIYVEHVVDVLVQALVVDSPAVVNVAGDEILSIRDIATTIGAVVGVEPRFEQIEEEGAPDMIADVTLLHRHFELARPLRSFAEGVAKIVEYTAARPPRP